MQAQPLQKEADSQSNTQPVSPGQDYDKSLQTDEKWALSQSDRSFEANNDIKIQFNQNIQLDLIIINYWLFYKIS